MNYTRAGEAIQATRRLDRMASGDPLKLAEAADAIADDPDLAATVLVSLAYLAAARGEQLRKNDTTAA